MQFSKVNFGMAFLLLLIFFCLCVTDQGLQQVSSATDFDIYFAGRVKNIASVLKNGEPYITTSCTTFSAAKAPVFFVKNDNSFVFSVSCIDGARYLIDTETVYLYNETGLYNGFIFNTRVINSKTYCTGYHIGSNEGCYWVDGNPHDLLGKDNLAYDIAVNAEGATVICGIQMQIFEQNEKACIWIEDSQHILSPNFNSRATSVAVHNENIYVAGTIVDEELHTKACYWKNEDIIVLCDERSMTYDISIFKQQVYIVGWYLDQEGKLVACYWVDGIKIDLPVPLNSNVHATCLTVENGSLFIGGQTTSGNKTLPCCWKDEQIFVFDTDYQPFWTGSIAVVYQ